MVSLKNLKQTFVPHGDRNSHAVESERMTTILSDDNGNALVRLLESQAIVALYMTMNGESLKYSKLQVLLAVIIDQSFEYSRRSQIN